MAVTSPRDGIPALPWRVATCALIAFLPMDAGAASATATGSGGTSASVHVDFAITVPRVLELRLDNLPPTLEVTADDVGRGRVRVSGSRILLVSNDPRGVTLRADLLHPAFRAVHIVGLRAAFDATREQSTALQPSSVGRPRPGAVDVAYEIELDGGAQPGRYAWPVALSLQQP